MCDLNILVNKMISARRCVAYFSKLYTLLDIISTVNLICKQQQQNYGNVFSQLLHVRAAETKCSAARNVQKNVTRNNKTFKMSIYS